ncbi:MAG: GNAT family N-acetyltransferase, partial [Promicromonosporaceae bacterium]|nr:GNAT family N-acetyltransferase [Promicromonosporaceae bacterium]
TVADLKRRQNEPWFNAGEFFLLQTATGQTIGYCWLKLATVETGEIYVIAVHSDHRRRGLATYLLTVAFAHLAAAGANEVMLYVEGDDAAALATYHKLGFTQRALDVQFAKVGS